LRRSSTHWQRTGRGGSTAVTEGGATDISVFRLVGARRAALRMARSADRLHQRLLRSAAPRAHQAQGRMEWGPRALGNRSIPRRPDMKATLNANRPFAPSVMEEAVAEWFEEDDSVPFMMQVFQVREEKRKLIPAVTHVDGSGRLQTVTSSTNPRYHKLIESFRDLTGIRGDRLQTSGKAAWFNLRDTPSFALSPISIKRARAMHHVRGWRSRR
jgi:hypothetical protein